MMEDLKSSQTREADLVSQLEKSKKKLVDAKKQWASYVEEYDKNAELASQKLAKLKSEKAALGDELSQL